MKSKPSLLLLITDSKGVVVAQSTVTARPGANVFLFNLQHLAKGLYFVTIRRDAGTIVSRIIKQ